ncbi:MAG: dephospho-CoA kinase [Tissierellia bacterium]|nr:dephospho-CoA kinase [Tissierellia bacterium]
MEQNKLIIGLTGGISTGKSTATSYLLSLGYEVIDADVGARVVVVPGSEGLKKLSDQFGNGILNNLGELDREALAKKIFPNERNRLILNNIIHPLVYKWMLEEYEKIDSNIVFFDIPLLFESNVINSDIIKFDEIWLISSSKNTQINRLMKRDNIDEAYALKKIDSQLALDIKSAKADRVFNNDASREELFSQLYDACKSLERKVI